MIIFGQNQRLRRIDLGVRPGSMQVSGKDVVKINSTTHRKSRLIHLSSAEDSPLVRAILSGFSQPCTSLLENMSEIIWF